MGVLWIVGLMLVAASKLLFYAYGIGRQYDFTGISGHAFRAAFLYPLLVWIGFDRTSTKKFFVAMGTAFLLVLLIGFSRYYYSYHTWLELIPGFVLGGFGAYFSIKILIRIIDGNGFSPKLFCLLGIIVAVIALSLADAPTVRWLRELATWLTGEPFHRR